MATVAANHYIGVLVIDEIQRLSLAKSGGADLLLNFFVQLVNDMGVPVVLVGTYGALAVLSGQFSVLRRGTGQGDLIWDRMQKDGQWELFVKSLFRAQYTRKAFSADDIADPPPTDPIRKQPTQPQRLSDVLYERVRESQTLPSRFICSLRTGDRHGKGDCNCQHHSFSRKRQIRDAKRSSHRDEI